MEHIRAMELERYFAGELGGADAERVKQHVEGCAECGAVLVGLEAGRISFLNAHPFEEFARCKRLDKNYSNFHINISNINMTDWIMNVKKKIFFGRLNPSGAYGIIFAVVLVLMFVPLALTTYWNKSSMDENTSSVGGDIRYKGLDRLAFLLMRDGEVRLGSSTEIYRAGDRLQVIYSYPKSHHAALFSVDNAGTLSFYTGGEGGNSICSTPADSGSDLAVKSSIVLDDSRGEELVVMLISETPVLSKKVGDVIKRLSKWNYSDLSRIEDGLRRGGLGGNVSVSSVRIKKE
jgi:hypothetical protein